MKDWRATWFLIFWLITIKFTIRPKMRKFESKKCNRNVVLLQIVLQPQLYTIPLNFFYYYKLTLTNLVACWNLWIEQDLIFHYHLMNFLYNLSPLKKTLRMMVRNLTQRAYGLLNEPDGGETKSYDHYIDKLLVS